VRAGGSGDEAAEGAKPVGLFGARRASRAGADAEVRGRKAKEKWLAQHEANWHMRAAAATHPEAAEAVHEFCRNVGFVRRATLAEVRLSEKDPVRLLVGLRVGKEVQPRFSEVAGALLRSLAAKVPDERAVEVEAIEVDTEARSPYDVFP